MSQVTDEYLMGIRDGREYLKKFQPDLFDMHMLLANIDMTLRQRLGREVSDHLRGERDFWKHQIKKSSNPSARDAYDKSYDLARVSARDAYDNL